MNNAYAAYSFDYFLDSMDALGLNQIDLWGGYSTSIPSMQIRSIWRPSGAEYGTGECESLRIRQNCLHIHLISLRRIDGCGKTAWLTRDAILKSVQSWSAR